MRYSFVILQFIFPFFMGTACDTVTPGPESANTESNDYEDYGSMNDKITIKIGDKTFTATLSDNATAIAFKSLLPMTITMTELNGNEKYFDLKGSLPTNASRPSTIQAGDFMLYGSRTLVLFYKTFSTTYSYTSLGRVDDTTGLASALGSGNVTVIIEMQ